MAQLMMSVFPLLACISVAAYEAKQSTTERLDVPKDQLEPALAAGATYLPLNEARQGTLHGLFEG
jgi:hypothetical protein